VEVRAGVADISEAIVVAIGLLNVGPVGAVVADVADAVFVAVNLVDVG